MRNWLSVVVAMILMIGVAGTADATLYKFDFNNYGSPTAAGYTSILPSTDFSALGYGWKAHPWNTIGARDRGLSYSDLLRDMNVGSVDATFGVNVVNDAWYKVTMTFFDTFSHSKIEVFAEESANAAFTLNYVSPNVVTKTFSTFVDDGTLDLKFNQSTGNPYASWIINDLEIEGPYSANPVPEPGTMVLLGTGMLGLAVFTKRRKNA